MSSASRNTGANTAYKGKTMKNRILALTIEAAAVMAAPAHAAFKCVDEKGRTYIGDTPPEACAKVVMYEVTRGGQVIRTIQPSLTEEQVKARLEEEEKKKEADKAAFEQKRKDLALLATYSTEAEFDVARDRNIDPINARIKLAQERIGDIDKRNKQLDEELEFYKAGKSGKSKAPEGGGKKSDTGAMLQEEQTRLKAEKSQVQKTILGSEKEIADLKAKFEVDKKRWIALKSGKAGAGTSDAPADAKATDAKAEAKTTEAKADAKAAPKAAPKKN